MRLLVLVHRLPCPPDRGAKLRAAAELHWLMRRHEVWCAGFIDPPTGEQGRAATEAALATLRRGCQALAAVPLSRWPATVRALLSLAAGGTASEAYFASPGLRRQVLAWARQVRFDAVLAFSSSMAPLALMVPAERRVLDLVDLDSRKWQELADGAGWPRAWAYRAEADRLADREAQWLAVFDASTVCTQREADLIADRRLRARVRVIETGAVYEPVGEDRDRCVEADGKSERFAPSASPCGLKPAAQAATREVAQSAGLRPCRLPDEPVVGMLGAMDYSPNVDGACWFAGEIWPRILSRCPDACWWIVGRSPARAVRKLADGRRVWVTGTVPAVEPYVRRLRVSVAPLRVARGVQTKVLTAMAEGRPCVVTPCVAEGIGARIGREILVCDSPAAFADTVIGLFNDRARAEEIGEAGRRFVRSRYVAAEGLAELESLLAGGSTAHGGMNSCYKPPLSSGGQLPADAGSLWNCTGETPGPHQFV